MTCVRPTLVAPVLIVAVSLGCVRSERIGRLGASVDAPESCADVDCGPAGICSQVSGQARCVCADGFTAVAASCRAEEPQVLRVELATANTIAWAWDPTLIAGPVSGYLLWYGTDPDAVHARLAPANVWTGVDDPNLGWAVSPFGPNTVQRTAVLGLAAQTSYVAELWAQYPDRPSTRVAAGSASTAAVAADRLLLFEDALPGVSYPVCCQVEPAADDPGNAVLAIDTQTAPTSCNANWVNLRLYDLAVDTNAVPAQRWADAYLELALRATQVDQRPLPVHYIEVGLFVDGLGPYAFADEQHYAVLPAEPGWQVLQIPLVMLRDASSATPSLGGTVTQLQVGAAWGISWRVEMDDVAIRY